MSGLRIAIYHHLHSGGALRVVGEQLARLVDGHQVALYSLSSAAHLPAAGGAEQVATRIPYQPLPLARSPLGRINPLIRIVELMRLDQLARHTAELIDGAGFDVALVHPCQITQAPLLLRWLRTPALYYCHELPRLLYEAWPPRAYWRRGRLKGALDALDPLPTCYHGLLRRLDRDSAQAAARIATNSRFTQANVMSAYRRHAEVCYQGVDGEEFAPRARQREPFVLSVGALTPLKGFDFIIRALAQIPEDRRPRLVLVSNYQDAQEHRYLCELAASSGVAMECRAAVSEEELRGLYARAACVAYAPIREPFGLVALEAMSARAPVVAVAEGGVRETVIDGVTGVLTERREAAFGAAIAGLLSDGGRAAQLGEAARRYVRECWTWERHSEHLERLLQQTAGTQTMPQRGEPYAAARLSP